MVYKITCLEYDGKLIASVPKNENFFTLEETNGAILADTGEKNDFKALSEALSYAAVSILPALFVKKLIPKTLAEEEKAYLLSNALFEIYSDSELLEETRKNIAAELLLSLKTHYEIDLMGIVRFRLKKAVRQWKKAAEKCIKSYKSGAEISKIIDFLSDYAEHVSSKEKYLKVITSSDGYLLKRKDGTLCQIMPPESEEFFGMEAEDILLSRLINISPQSIDISEVYNEALILLIKSIFPGRIVK